MLMNVSDSEFQELVPKGTRSLLVQPILQVSLESATDSQKSVGFILLVSTMRYAFSIKDRAWIAAVANKLRGNSIINHVYKFVDEFMLRFLLVKPVCYILFYK
jgi:hypothetical protein